MNIQRIIATALFTGVVFAQQPAKDIDNIEKIVQQMEISLFGGFSGYQNHGKNKPSGSDLDEGGVVGFRVGFRLNPYVSVEGSYSYARNNLVLSRSAPQTGVGFGARNQGLSINPVVYFVSDENKIQPYITGGFGGVWFQPTGAAKSQGKQAPYAALGAGRLETRFETAFNWGGGVKVNLNKVVNLRFDGRNIWALNPHFNLPSAPQTPGGFFIAPKGWQNGAQFTAGIGFALGRHEPAAAKAIKVTLTGDTSNITQGQARVYNATVEGPPKGMTEAWTLNGSKINVDGNSYTFDSSTRPPGQYKLCVSAEAKGWTPDSKCLDFTVVEAIRAFDLTLTADQPSVRIGTSDTLHARTNLPAGVTPTYSWTVNGNKVAETGPNFTFNTAGLRPGTYNVCVTASAPGYNDSQKCMQIVVQDCGNPTLSISGGGTREIMAGESTKFNADARPNDCGSPVKVTWQASEGNISPDGNFDSSSITFDPQGGLQRKTVNITATATDEQGHTATANGTVIVRFNPAAQRLDDLVFGAGSARVNNCDKRLLLEVLAAKLKSDPTAQIVLIGHMAKGEGVVRGKGKNAHRAAVAGLDKARVLNAAAVLSAGTGICSSVDLSRIKVGYAGAESSSQPMLAFCGTSTQVKGRKTSEADANLDFRRVEVWFVPTGAKLPESSVKLSDAPAAAIQSKGCPK